MSDMVTVRDLDIITSEIKVIEQQVVKTAIYGCIEIGKRLVEAKEIVGHGGWGKYLEDHVQYSQQWATNLMNLYREYGQSQESLFENFANSQSFGNLEVTKHILLLGIPAEERAAFVAEHDAEHSSVRELKEAIRERDEARKAVSEQSERAKQLEEQLDGTLRELENAGAELAKRDAVVQKLREDAHRTEQKEADAVGKVAELQEQLRESEKAVQVAECALKAAREHPEVPESMMESLRQEAEAKAAKQAAEKVKKELEAARNAEEKARKEGKDLRARLAEAEKQARQGTAELERVKIYLKGTQEQFQNLLDALLEVKLQDPDTGARMQANIRDKLITGMQKALAEV